jgi:hypothetical protein
MAARFQRGHIFEAHNAFHVRYYDSEIIDGQPRRVQRSERLCSKTISTSARLARRFSKRPLMS